jgi:alpha-tubulin suppressor-like RCC1 family protein
LPEEQLGNKFLMEIIIHSAIKTDGTLWVWGDGGERLGIMILPNRSTPVTTFAGGNNWKQVSAGRWNPLEVHTAAIKTDGTLWGWGINARESSTWSLWIWGIIDK